jgi:tetratricopeptide (TPR) repeat protein
MMGALRFTKILIPVLAGLVLLPAIPAQTVVVEGQDAVSTNFASEPVQLFGAGGNLALQLNQPALLSDAPYYADFVFLVDQAGEYQLWYGGSLPGADDPFLPSYGSPFTVAIDDQEPLQVTAESVAVGPVYSTPYRWIRIGPVALEEGQHRLRVTVDQRRRYDSRYFLYLDRFVLVRTADTDSPSVAELQLPADEQLRLEPESIEDLLIILREEPNNLEAYIRLAHLYTLVGDHINALRYLSRAQLLDAGNVEVLQLVARNTIWRGDMEGGLTAYWALVSAAPQRIETFLEAGKISAWAGFLGASEQFYLAGLQHHADDPRLLANLAFTYLWWNREDRARELFNRTERLAAGDEDILLLGREYRINSDMAREETLYRAALERLPQSPELAERLLDAVYAQGRAAEAQELRDQLERQIPAAAARFAQIAQRYALRDALIEQYEQAVRDNPRDLGRRADLAQTYFWIGRRQEGIRVFRNLLAARTQQQLHRSWQDGSAPAWLLVQTAHTRYLVREYLPELTRDGAELAAAVQQYRSLQQQEGADLTAPRAAIVELAGRLETMVAAARQALDLQETAVTPEMEAIGQELEERQAELEAVRAQRDWTPPVAALARELGEATDLVGYRRTSRLLTGLLDPQQESEALPEVQVLPVESDQAAREVLHAESPALLVLLGRDAPGATLVRQWFVLEELLTLNQEEPVPAALRNLLVFSELLREPLRSRSAADPTPVAASAWAFDLSAAEALQTAATELVGTLAVAIRTLDTQVSTLRRTMEVGTELAIFYLQTETAPERNRLGQLYIDAGEIDAAVTQLELVRAVDPENLATLFTLAQAYRRLGRWRQARDLLVEIYQRDPGYRNTVALHNEIARQYADEFHGETRLVSEPQRVQSHSVMGYLWRINSRFSVRASLEAGSVRARVPAFYTGEAEGDLSIGVVRRIAYQEYAFRGGLVTSLPGERVTVEPELGVRLLAHNLYYATRQDALVTTAWDGADYFGSYRVEPEPGVRWNWSAGELFHAGTYRFGPHRAANDIPVETVRLERPVYRAHQLAADLSWTLQNRADPFWSRYSQRTGGGADLIYADGGYEGLRFSLQQEFRLGLIRRSEPFTRLGVAATVGYEDFTGEDALWYYQPESVFESGARLDWQLYRPLRADLTWGLAGTFYSGYYQPQFPGDADDSAIRSALQVTAELTRHNIAFPAGALGKSGADRRSRRRFSGRRRILEHGGIPGGGGAQFPRTGAVTYAE